MWGIALWTRKMRAQYHETRPKVKKKVASWWFLSDCFLALSRGPATISISSLRCVCVRFQLTDVNGPTIFTAVRTDRPRSARLRFLGVLDIERSELLVPLRWLSAF